MKFFSVGFLTATSLFLSSANASTSEERFSRFTVEDCAINELSIVADENDFEKYGKVSFTNCEMIENPKNVNSHSNSSFKIHPNLRGAKNSISGSEMYQMLLSAKNSGIRVKIKSVYIDADVYTMHGSDSWSLFFIEGSDGSSFDMFNFDGSVYK